MEPLPIQLVSDCIEAVSRLAKCIDSFQQLSVIRKLLVFRNWPHKRVTTRESSNPVKRDFCLFTLSFHIQRDLFEKESRNFLTILRSCVGIVP